MDPTFNHAVSKKDQRLILLQVKVLLHVFYAVTDKCQVMEMIFSKPQLRRLKNLGLKIRNRVWLCHRALVLLSPKKKHKRNVARNELAMVWTLLQILLNETTLRISPLLRKAVPVKTPRHQRLLMPRGQRRQKRRPENH